MGSHNIQIAKLEEQNIGELFLFRKRIFPKNIKQLDRKRWEWLFIKKRSAGDNEIQTWLLSDDTGITGTISCIPSKVRVGGKEVICSFGCDYYVDNKNRGLPALRLLKAMLGQYGVSVMANVSPVAKKLLLKMGYSNLSSNLCVVTAYFPTNNGKAGLPSLLKFYFYDFLRKTFCSKRYSTIHVKKIPESVNKLWGTLARQLPVSVVKDVDYLKWRYEDCLSVDYRFVTIEHNQQIVALAVVTVQDENVGEKRGLISDLLVDPDDLSACCGIINATLDFFLAEGCTSCFCELLHNRMLRSFTLMGFSVTRSNLGLLVLVHKRHKQELKDLINPGKWAFFVGDTDRY